MQAVTLAMTRLGPAEFRGRLLSKRSRTVNFASYGFLGQGKAQGRRRSCTFLLTGGRGLQPLLPCWTQEGIVEALLQRVA